MPSPPWRVFLSHTSDLASYVEAAEAAVLRAGHAVTDMKYFTARDSLPAEVCRDAVLKADVYVLLAGSRYGSSVRDNPSESYTELEFRVAGEKGMPRLAFRVTDAGELEPRQREFHTRAADSGLTLGMAGSPARLETMLFQALIELAAAPPVWSVPPLRGTEVARPALTAALIEAVLAPDAALVGVTTGLVGAGGFGKTTLARMVAHDPAVRAAFPDGTAWVTVGEDAHGPELAASITSAARLFDPSAPEVTDPLAAGAILDRALAGRRALLIVDDVWTTEQVEPFRLGGDGVRLFTTRQRDILPSSTAAVPVDQMTPAEARLMIGAGVPAGLVEEALDATGRWPVLLALVDGAVRDGITHGGDPVSEMREVLDALRADGITVLDVGDAGSRTTAVARTIDASLRRLAADERDRYLELAVFGEDVTIPGSVVSRLWAHTGGWSAFRSRRFCARLYGQGLLAGYRRDPDEAQLHDVVRAYLRHRTADRRADLDRAIVDAHRELAPDGWSSLPADQSYLWTWLPAHLWGADLEDELDDLLNDPYWLVGKLERLGPAALEADLLLGERDQLAAVVRQNAHLLGPLDPPGSLAAVLASRIPPNLGFSAECDDLLSTVDGPYLRPVIPLSDLADPALIRVIATDEYLLTMCVAPNGSWLAALGSDINIVDPRSGALRYTLQNSSHPTGELVVAPDGSWLAASVGYGTIRLWDPLTGVPLRVLDAGSATVRRLVVAPDGSWLAAASEDATVRLWDPRSGEYLRTLATDVRSRNLTVAPDGRWLATSTVTGGIYVWDPVTGRQLSRMPGEFRAIAADPGGRWLATEGAIDGMRVWDTTTWTETAELNFKIHKAAAVAPDGGWLAVAGRDGMVAVWNTVTWADPLLLNRGEHDVHLLLAAPDGTWLAAVAQQGEVVVLWATDRWDRRAHLVGHTEKVHTLHTDPGGTWLATAADDGTIRLWNPDLVDYQHRDPEFSTSFSPLAVAPTGWVAAATDAGDVLFWNLADRTHGRLSSDENLLGIGAKVVIAPDGSWIAAADFGTLLVWDRTSGEVLHQLTTWGEAEFLMAGPDSTWLAVGGSGIEFWDPRSGRLLKPRLGESPTTGFAGASNGRIFAVAERSGAINLWSGPTADPVLLHDFGPAASAPIMTMAPDGSWLVTSELNGGTRIWDTADGTARTIVDSTTPSLLLAAAPDSSWLALLGADSLLVWDCRKGTHERTIDLGPTPPNSMTITADGLICGVGFGNLVRVWDPATGRLLAALRVEDELDAGATSQDWIIASGQRHAYFLELVRPAGML
ncbi:WD40 repeat protein [Actinoplanes tereljensis]|uniref:WD40 repeat protein n=1 Tax=Paractinoplanes tereljensis TaxID=571912 RepID=A0A919NGM0_9ACTN|nr:DUF4062 domain-containing protein [Actinoplanes tereljensis]GIF17833.1 hypothetical protein Ate02nite_05630 [Actinoplanes tereljensis]